MLTIEKLRAWGADTEDGLRKCMNKRRSISAWRRSSPPGIPSWRCSNDCINYDF